MPERLPAPDECANCGAPIPPTSHACPACGADERTGWREASVYDGIDLPDSAHDNAVEPSQPYQPRPGNPALGRILFVLFLAVLTALFLLGR